MPEDLKDLIFYAAPFAIDGNLIGIGEWRISQLSPQWLGVCRDTLRAHGMHFRASFGKSLEHLELKFSTTDGVGIGTFFSHGRIVISTAYLRGTDPASESEVLEMFLESLRKLAAAFLPDLSKSAFEAVTTIKDRPLHIIVAWANPETSEADENLVSELANHFAGAYLCGGTE